MSDPASGRSYWDAVAGKKEFTVPLPEALLTRYVASDAALLDCGCGYGRSLAELQSRGYRRLAGCDFSSAMIALARARVPDAELKVNAPLELPFADRCFDAVLLLAVLTCIIADADQQRMLGEIVRVLRPGGVVIAGDFLLNTDARNQARYRQYQAQFGTYGVFALPEEGAVLRHHDRAWLETLFAGFDALDFQTTVYRTMNGHRSNGFYFVGKRTERTGSNA